MSTPVLFVATTPLGFDIRVTEEYWELIVTIKHPIMHGRDAEVVRVLQEPDEIRKSRRDPAVYLFYREERPGRWICAVARRLNGEGFLITTYPTDAIKEGDRVWSR